MLKILNRGLNFCITPETLNFTEIMADRRAFERKYRWHEFWFNEDEDENLVKPVYVPPIFKKLKTSVPTGTSTGVMIFLNGVKSEISSTPTNKISSNITSGEIEALKTLVKLQKEKVIVIKPVLFG